MSIDVFPASVLNSTLWNGQSMPLSIAGGGSGATTAAQARTNYGLGTMAQQDAATVAITGGSITGLTTLSTTGTVGVRRAPAADVGFFLDYMKSSIYGIALHAADNDTGVFAAMLFTNVSGTPVGSITATGSATAYNTSSDVRLKHALTALTGALDKVQALRPVSFLWNADGSPGEGFVAHELQTVIPNAVSGQPDEVNEDGSVRPQGVDHSKIVPWLTAALQETLAQVQALVARVESLEQQLGI